MNIIQFLNHGWSLKKEKNKNFKIFSSNHGGSYGTNLKIFDYNKIKSFQNINYSSRKFNKDINLPCLFLSKKSQETLTKF